jgi:DNA mismatch repair protein MutS
VLEKGDARGKGKGGGKSGPAVAVAGSLDDLPLFAATRPKSFIALRAEPSEVETALADINPDELTPRAALEAIYKLKGMAAKSKA